MQCNAKSIPRRKIQVSLLPDKIPTKSICGWRIGERQCRYEGRNGERSMLRPNNAHVAMRYHLLTADEQTLTASSYSYFLQLTMVYSIDMENSGT